jgi:tol-pal system protein YbgF
MTKGLKAAVLLTGMAICLLCDHVCVAQQFKQVPPAPIPQQIVTATKVFIANGGGDESLIFDSPQYSGGPDRLYNEFYAAIKSWGRYELVGTPGEADLVFEIRLTLIQPRRANVLGDDKPEYDSQFHLIIRDVKAHETLWGLTEHSEMAILQNNRDKNFELALAAILSELRKIAGSAPADALSADFLYSNGQRDITSGKYEVARQEFQDYLKYYGDTALASNARFYLGEIAYSQKNYRDAVNQYSLVPIDYPKSLRIASAQYKKGLALIELGQRTAGVRELEQVIRRFPGTEEERGARAKLQEMGIAP